MDIWTEVVAVILLVLRHLQYLMSVDITTPAARRLLILKSMEVD